MGKILRDLTYDCFVSDVSLGDAMILTILAGMADDNTQDVVIKGKRRTNKIGDHAYPSLTEISNKTRTTRATVRRHIKNLKNAHWIEEVEGYKTPSGAKCYRINISKLFRCLVFRQTIKAHNIKEIEFDKKIEQQEVDKRYQLLYQYTYDYYDDDFSHPPVQSLTWSLKVPHIEDLDDVIELPPGQLRDYFQYEVKKIISAAGNNTDNQKQDNTKEHEKSLSREDNTTQENDYDNQNSLEGLLDECPDGITTARWEKFKQHFPHKQPYKTAKGIIDETVEFGIAQLNQQGKLDPELAEYWDEKENEYFNKKNTGGLYQLEKYNNQWKDCLGELASRKFSSIKV